MSNSSTKMDVSDVVDGLRGLISSALSGVSKISGSEPSDSDMRIAIMTVLSGGAKNGKEVIQHISLSSGGKWVPSSSKIYPMLEAMTDEKLVAIKIEKELRVYSLTKEGKKALEEASVKAAQNPEMKPENVRSNSKLEASSETLKAGAKLAQALSQVAQHGTPEQQKRAIELLDKTRRQIYAILSEG